MIEFMVSGRKTGKTSSLIEWLRLEPNGVIVCHSEQERQRILKKIKEMPWGNEIKDNQVISASSSREKLAGRNVVVAVDNVDIVLSWLLGAEIQRATATGILINRYD